MVNKGFFGIKFPEGFDNIETITDDDAVMVYSVAAGKLVKMLLSDFPSGIGLDNYYTKTNLQTAGQAQVHFDNLTNKPSTYAPPLASSTVRGGVKVGYSATGANLPLQLSSEKAYIALTSAAIVAALTFTPYSAANPAGYISGITKAMVENVLDGEILTHTHPYIPITQKGAANGVASLDAGGKVPSTQLPNTLLIYKGVWNPVTNTPTLLDVDVSKAGFVYNVSHVGSRFGINWKLGDWAIYNDLGVLEKSDNSDDVVSVNGKQGAVVLTTTDIAEGTNLYYTNARVRASISLTTTGNSGAASYTPATGAINVPNYTLAGLGFTGDTNANHYTHPSKAWVDKTTLAGAVVISNITVDSLGHPTGWSTRSLTPANIGAEPAFAKNTAFNKNFGTIAGTVSEGDHSHAYIPTSHTVNSIVNGTGFLKNNGTGTWSYDNNSYYLASNPNNYTSNLGTVTSVAMSVPTGFSVAGSPITTNGTLALSFATGYSLPTTAKQGNWDSAYNHVTNNGSDHSYINQSVTTTSTPTFSGIYGNGTTWNMIFNNASYVFIRDGSNTSTIRFYPTTGNIWTSGTLTASGYNSSNWDSAYTFTNGYATNYPDLVAIEALTGTSGLLKKTAANTWALDTNTYLTSYTETDPVFVAWRDASRTVKTVYAAPTAAAGTPTWRQLAYADISGLGDAATKTVGTSSGNVMEVGAFGLGVQSPIITTSTDLDNLGTTSGVNTFFGASNSAAPVFMAGIHLQRVLSGSQRGGQIALPCDDTSPGTRGLMFRLLSNNIWGDWRTVWHDGSLVNPVTKTGSVTAGMVSYWDGTGNSQAGSANFIWDNTNDRLGINVTPTHNFHVGNNIATIYSSSQKFGDASFLRVQNLSNTTNTYSAIDISAGTNFSSMVRLAAINIGGSTSTATDFAILVRRNSDNNFIERLRILEDGGVAIGKTSVTSGYLLDVNGAIISSGNVRGNGFLIGANTVIDASRNASFANLTATGTTTLATSLTGLLKATTGVVSAATPGTDYVSPNAAITGATKTKITYDGKGLVTSGADATFLDLSDTPANYTNAAYKRVRVNSTATGLEYEPTQTPQVLTVSSNTLTWNVANGYNARVTLTANVTTFNFSGAVAGDSGVLTVIQDGTGGRTMVLPSGHKIGNGVFGLTGSANAVDIMGWYYDGVNYIWNIDHDFKTL